MLTKSYILYTKFHKRHKTEKMMVSHYDFIKLIAIAWIDPENYGPQTPLRNLPKTKRETSETSQRPTTRRKIIETESVASGDTKRCREVKDDTLDPLKGLLKMRLYHSTLAPRSDGKKVPVTSLGERQRG